MNKIKYILLVLLIGFIACKENKKQPTPIPPQEQTLEELKVFQINIWQEGTQVEGGFEAIVDEIIHTDADVVLLCEIRNYNDTDFIQRLINRLDEKGAKYYGHMSNNDDGIISKLKIESQTNIPSMLKSKIAVNGTKLVVYSAHLDYTNYACYLPRGYSGVTWKELDAPVTNIDSILKMNRDSKRDDAIEAFIRDAKEEIAKGNIVIMGGDFNEPSHLDWQANTKDLFDHNGTVVNWDCSVMLIENGYKDAFREKYPNPVTHPGFTFPSYNANVGMDKLAWAPKVDERDRIDFIYYMPSERISLEDIVIVGPSQTIIKGKKEESDSQDKFLTPKGVWATDHKALLATFKLK